MPRKKTASRHDSFLFATSLEDFIGPENPVRVVEAFVNSLDMAKLNLHLANESPLGAPSYAPSDLLKLYLYGYLNRIRSSRCLERECQRNVEVMWLIRRQTPSYHTISSFRTLLLKDEKTGRELCNHRKALVQVFRLFNQFCDQMSLFGKQTQAVDGTKIAAQNSKKRHVSEEKIKRKLAHIDARIEEYLEALDAAERQSEAEGHLDKGNVQQALEELKQNREKVLQLADQLAAAQAEDPSVTQICLTDPDARMLPINNEGMMQIAYNAQTVVDDQHYLIADFEVENRKDLYLLAPMAASVRSHLHIRGTFRLLADKGYHAGAGLQACADQDVCTYVACPERSYGERPTGFTKADFRFDKERNVYLCPNNMELTTTGRWHEKYGRQGHLQARFQRYRCSFTLCSQCPMKEQCLSTANLEQRHGRSLERSEYEEVVEANRRRILRRAADVQAPAGHRGAPLRNHQTLLGLLLHAVAAQGQGKGRDGYCFHGVQPSPSYVHSGRRSDDRGPERGFFCFFRQVALQGAGDAPRSAFRSLALGADS